MTTIQQSPSVANGATYTQGESLRGDSYTLLDPLLALTADTLGDLERTRIASENRVRQLTRAVEDSDGELRGLGLPDDDPRVGALTAVSDGLVALEKQAEKELKRQLHHSPLGPWFKAQGGIGDKQGARLLASVGDPYWHRLEDRPRTVGELWAFAGYHVLTAGLTGVAPTRARGHKANWSADAKMRAYLVAESCVKQLRKPCHKEEDAVAAVHETDCGCSHYRRVYDDGRTKYAEAIHQVECRRCGPKGTPALAGSVLSSGHQHARAMRLVSKEILRQLFIESKRLHELAADKAEKATP